MSSQSRIRGSPKTFARPSALGHLHRGRQEHAREARAVPCCCPVDNGTASRPRTTGSVGNDRGAPVATGCAGRAELATDRADAALKYAASRRFRNAKAPLDAASQRKRPMVKNAGCRSAAGLHGSKVGATICSLGTPAVSPPSTATGRLQPASAGRARSCGEAHRQPSRPSARQAYGRRRTSSGPSRRGRSCGPP